MKRYFDNNIQPAVDRLNELMAAPDTHLKEFNQAQEELGQLLWQKDKIEREIADAQDTLEFACWKLGHDWAHNKCMNCGADAVTDEEYRLD